MAELFLREDFASGGEDGEPLSADCRAADLLQWARRTASQAAPGDIYRDKEGRKTLRFRRGGRSYFLKLHSGIGWGEVFKNLLQLRLPVPGAGNEYRAVVALQQIGVDTMSVAAYASVGSNPAARQSLIVTDDLVGTVSLEDYCADWSKRPPPFAVRLRLIRKLADSSRRMHGAGINHRDFYICHFHLDESTLSDPAPRCHLIDLHRAQLRRAVPRRWLEKDLAGLYFSAMDCGLTRRDLLRFMRTYSGKPLRQTLEEDLPFWRAVGKRAGRLYIQENGEVTPHAGHLLQ